MTEPGRAVRLAHELRGLRESAKLTQAQLANVFASEKPVAAATVSSWESTTNPKTPPDDRLKAYARLFAVPRALEPEPRLIAESDLTDDEQAAVRAFVERLHEIDRVVETGSSTLTFDKGPITVVCPDAPGDSRGPLAREQDPNFTKLHQYADLDALIELYGHLRAYNPRLDVFQKLASEVDADDLTSDVIALGGIGWNMVTEQILDALKQTLPITQVNDPGLSTGEPFVVDGATRFDPTWSDGDDRRLKEDVALLARLPNPYNVSRTLTFCNGIHSRGVLGAVRCLTDHMMRATNERYLAERFPGGKFALLLRVRVVGGRTLTPDLQNPDTRLFEWPGPGVDA